MVFTTNRQNGQMPKRVEIDRKDGTLTWSPFRAGCISPASTNTGNRKRQRIQTKPEQKDISRPTSLSPCPQSHSSRSIIMVINNVGEPLGH
ncbi:hypothetical protein VTN49DRAFT_1890 [Thermomyces lanuginosus]|uniref:uncharacterized protein n=1 Tax=Thermomyces lanuginosus TaxID=5541 RepID=UPI0037437EFD